MWKTALVLATTFSWAQAAETVLGVFLFSRHGDRTSKATPPTNLTDLGYRQILSSGTYFRDRYISSNATSRINGINTDLVKLSQLAVSAPQDNVLQSSASKSSSLWRAPSSLPGSLPLLPRYLPLLPSHRSPEILRSNGENCHDQALSNVWM